jgi:peroxiredoxin
VLSDEGNKVAERYGVMRWQAATGEPGHTFVLIDESGRVAWVKDYGALENGGIMYVLPDELVREVSDRL